MSTELRHRALPATREQALRRERRRRGEDRDEGAIDW